MDEKDILDNIAVIHKDERSWYDILTEAIRWLNPFSLQPFVQISKIADQSCKTVIIENDYVDVDYLDMYSVYYSTLFAQYQSKCTRLHFFSENVTHADLFDLSNKKKSYLGYCILRPTQSFQVSRTVLKPPYDDGHSIFTLCVAKFHVNLAGNQLEVTGAPFIQQDTNVNVCAQASMWMASLYMHKRFDAQRLLPSQINELATKYLTVGPVREGLVDEQMLMALREMGFEPHYFPAYDPHFTARMIYGYVESAVPVILLLKIGNNGHAVTAVGHDFNVQQVPENDWTSNVHWVENFYVQDDASGPYMELGIKTAKGEAARKLYSLEEHVKGLIVPTPKEVKIRLDDVYDNIAYIMGGKDLLNLLIKLFPEVSPDVLFKEEDFCGLVFRTYLIRSNDFKTEVCSDIRDPAIRSLYRATRMPKYVWVTEISTKELINQPSSNDRKRIGEVVIDSTADRHSRLSLYVSIHFRGRLLLKKSADKPFLLHYNLNEQPCVHFARGPA